GERIRARPDHAAIPLGSAPRELTNWPIEDRRRLLDYVAQFGKHRRDPACPVKVGKRDFARWAQVHDGGRGERDRFEVIEPESEPAPPPPRDRGQREWGIGRAADGETPPRGIPDRSFGDALRDRPPFVKRRDDRRSRLPCQALLLARAGDDRGSARNGEAQGL